jgi:hypothetical protein
MEEAMTQSVRSKGYLRDVPDGRDWMLDALVGAAPIPPLVDWSHHLEGIRDQGATSSCVGQAFATVLSVRAKIASVAVPPISALHIYALARRGEQPLVDGGCRPRDAANGMRLYGVCAEPRWPFDAGKVNDPLPWDTLQAGADAHVDGYYRVAGDGETRCAALRLALAQGFPIAFAQEVDTEFENYSDGILGPFTGPSEGGHYTALVGYGPGWFFGVNSWGTSWGKNGLYRISDARIGSDVCSDFYALTMTPGGIR